MIEGSVFTSDHNHVLNWCDGLVRCLGQDRRSEVGEERDKAGAKGEVLPGLWAGADITFPPEMNADAATGLKPQFSMPVAAMLVCLL